MSLSRYGTCLACSSPTTQTWDVFWLTTVSRVTPSGRTFLCRDMSRWVLPETRLLSAAANVYLSNNVWSVSLFPKINVVLAECRRDRRDGNCAETLQMSDSTGSCVLVFLKLKNNFLLQIKSHIWKLATSDMKKSRKTKLMNEIWFSAVAVNTTHRQQSSSCVLTCLTVLSQIRLLLSQL